MPGRIPIFLSAVALSSFASAAVPADPIITAAPVVPRQNNDRFIGYLQFSSSWFSETCNVGLTWYQDNKYAQCCPTSLASCYAPTACFSGSLIYPYPDKSTTRTIPCTENYGDSKLSICNTAFIYENMQDSSPKTDIVCGQSSVNWSYYRSVPASVTQVKSQIPTSIPQPVSTANTSPDQSTNSSSSGGGSKAWIAGVVVGPIVGLALIGAAIFFFLRKRKNRKTAHQQGGAAMAGNPSQPPAGVAGYTDAKPQMAAQQQPYNPDPYANHGAYNAQQNYGQPPQPPQSPAPQYNGTGAPNEQGFYGNDVKQGYSAPAPTHGAAELGGETSGGAAPTNTAPAHVPHQAAELGGDSTQGTGAGLFSNNGGASELAASNSTRQY